MRKLAASGYPLFNTEVPNMQFGYKGAINLSNYPNVQMFKVLEEEDIAWTCSLDIAWIREASIWRGNIEHAKLTWEPDYGERPNTTLLDPYMPHSALADAEEYHTTVPSMSEVASIEEMGNTDMNAIPSLFVGSDSWVRFDKLNFGTLNPYSLTVRARGFDDGITIVAHEGGANGPIICEISIQKTPRETVAYTAILTRAISGTKDVTFTFRDRDGAKTGLVTTIY